MLDIVLIALMIMPFAVFAAFYATYNKIIALDQRCEQAYHDIDIQLRYRHELIPNIVEAVRGAMNHESDMLRAVVEARMQALGSMTQDQQLQSETRLGQAVGQLINMVEGYPDLKASEHFTGLRAELSDCEHKIAAARRFHNLATSEYNTVVSQFPGRKIAPMFRLHIRKFMDMTPERVFFEDTPEVKF